MVHIKDQQIERIDSDSAQKYTNQDFTLERCAINTLDLNALEFHGKVNIRHCTIHQLIIYGSWFSGGLNFSNNIVYSSIDYQMGGHNQKEIEISGNIFHGFFRFFDCQFEGRISVINNIFLQGSDLLAKENMGFDNIFKNGILIDNNIGQLDLIQ